MNTPTYDGLAAHFTRLHHFDHLYSVAQWDQAANMPPKGNDARSAAKTPVRKTAKKTARKAG